MRAEAIPCVRCGEPVTESGKDHCDECLRLLRAAIVSLRNYLAAQVALEERAAGGGN